MFECARGNRGPRACTRDRENYASTSEHAEETAERAIINARACAEPCHEPSAAAVKSVLRRAAARVLAKEQSLRAAVAALLMQVAADSCSTFVNCDCARCVGKFEPAIAHSP